MRGSVTMLLLAGLILSACDAGPYVGVGLGFGRHGVSVSPSVSGTVGDVTVGASL